VLLADKGWGLEQMATWHVVVVVVVFAVSAAAAAAAYEVVGMNIAENIVDGGFVFDSLHVVAEREPEH